MTEERIDYDLLVQNALRGVVREILERVQQSGLPGAHHFYIAFKTGAPGVILPGHLLERYPDEMTIVLQHRFWGLEVLEDRFTVGLYFNRKPEQITIPFAAIAGFVDPSVQFALQFPEQAEAAARPEAETTKSTGPSKEAGAGNGAPEEEKVVTLDRFRKKP